MSTRKFVDWNSPLNDIQNGLLLIRHMVKDIDIMLSDYELSEEKVEYLKMAKEKYEEFLQRYEGKGYALSDKVHTELMTPENISYAFEHGRYPKDPSKTFVSLSAEFEECFEIEQKIHDDIVAPIWEEYLSNGDDDLELGQDFAYVVHSGVGFISLPNMPGYRGGKYNNNSYISASLLTGKHMSMFNSNVGLILRINKDNLMAASYIDCVTRFGSTPNVNTVMIHDGEYIGVGYSYGIGSNEVVTKILTPKAIERYSIEKAKGQDGEILNYTGGKIINEVAVFKPEAKVDGVFLKSNGCDILLNEYIYAKQMEQAYGKKLKIINQSVYRKKEGLSPCTKEDIESFKQDIEAFSDPKNYGFIANDPEYVIHVLESYYSEVVEPNGYEEQVKTQIRSVFDKMISYGKSVIERKDGTRNSEDGQEPFDD